MEVNSQHSSLSCEEIFALLSEYLDEQLLPELCDSVAAHIQGCDPCIEFLQSLRKTITLCRQYQPHVILPPLADQVRRELRHAYENFLSTRKLSE